MAQTQFIIGIDLGTTNTVMAYSQYENAHYSDIRIFEIEQLIAQGEIAPRQQFPSVRYHSHVDELPAQACPSLWSTPDTRVVYGRWAQVLGAKSVGRLVTSAKSWLSHSGINPQEPILPWGSHADVAKVSPVEACYSYLNYLKQAWDHAHPQAPLAEQEIIITIPASFNEFARSLTLEAAKRAGLTQLKLVEEPQAACYDWLYNHQTQLHSALAGIQRLLVCDIGGGTCDFTLIDVSAKTGELPTLERIAVGQHLMLGGDNIDLALAKLIENQVSPDKALTPSELAQLILQCRHAKEQLLSSQAPESVNVTLLGRGQGLIKSSRSATLTREQVRNLVLNGFMPMTAQDEMPKARRSGLVEFGLPYPADAAITKHLAQFLQQTPDRLPDALLLNGGFFRSEQLQQRLVSILEKWGAQCQRLSNPHPDLAVARGAVAYALARKQQLLRIQSGSARSYLLVVEHPEHGEQALCILPQGSQEDVQYQLPNRFKLRLGQAVKFHLVSSVNLAHAHLGQALPMDAQWERLPAISTVLNSADQQGEVAVYVTARLTEIGTLDLHCKACDQNQVWQLAFEIRDTSATNSQSALYSHPKLNAAKELIQSCFGQAKEDLNAIKTLRNQLEKQLGPRHLWDLPLARALADELLTVSKRRRRSADHERVWLHLTGYCLRPGFGDAQDPPRIDALWQLFHGGIQYSNESPIWAEWWNLWRRCAGGLSAHQQSEVLQSFAKVLDPKRLASKQDPKGYDDMVKLAGALEQLSLDDKQRIGHWLLTRLQKSSESVQTWWAVGRLASRQLFHAPADYRLPVNRVEDWLTQALTVNWKNQPQAAFAAVLMARKINVPDAEVSDAMRTQVLSQLQAHKCPESWQRMVAEKVELNEEDAKRLLGEALPAGLIVLETELI